MHIEVTPTDSLVDEEVAIRVSDAPPRSRVTLTVEVYDAAGITWQSSAQFLAGEDGTFDVSKEPPIQGSYTTVDGMGLITNMTPQGKEPASLYHTADASDMQLTVTATEPTVEPASTNFTRRFLAAGGTVETIDESRVKGTLFLPGADDARPGVLVVPGEIGPDAVARPLAALLASHGYAAFVVDYRYESAFPDGIADVPLETLSNAADWMALHPRIEASKIGAYGIERGAEALLAAASHRIVNVRCLAVVSPSCVAWPGTQRGAVLPTSSWSAGGQPVPYLPLKGGKGQKLLRSITKKEGGAIAGLAAHRDAFNDQEAFAKAGFTIEKIDAPLLLFAGFADQQWPSGEMTELIYKARRSRNCNSDDQKLTFEGIGRVMRFPYVPATVFRYLDGAGGGQVLGGGNAAEAVRIDKVAWAKLQEFFTTHLGSAQSSD